MPRRPRRVLSLTKGAAGVLLDVCVAPSLWLFEVVAEHAGLDGALAACEARTLPPGLDLTGTGWTAASLPAPDAARLLVLGVRARAREQRGESHREAAEHLGVSRHDVRRALRELTRFEGEGKRRWPTSARTT